MILKSAFRQLRKNPFMNTLIVIQLTAVLTMICMLVSMIESRTEYYKPFAEEFSSEGYLCNFDLPLSEDYVVDSLKGAECEFTYSAQLYVNGQDPAEKNIPDTIVYSDKWINAYTPQMQSGAWLSEIPDNGYIHAVVTPDNPFGLTTGDIFDISDIDGNTEKAMVCGVVKNKQYTVGYPAFSQTDLPNRNNFFDMYYTYNTQVETDRWGIYLVKNELEYSELKGSIAVYGMGFVLCSGLNSGDKAEILNVLQTELAPMYTKPLEEIRSGSFEYIKEQLYVLLPIALCIFILTLITTVSVVSISVNGQLRAYAVFYICGARWKDCLLISAVYSLIVCIFSGVLSLCALVFLTHKTQTVIHFGLYEAAAIHIILIIFLCLSAIVPMTVMHRNQPKDILKKE
jgi:hypothetical protein